MSRIYIPSSWFVKFTRCYKQWCAITECKGCGLRAKYEDVHPVDPCPNCGGEVIEKVGRWTIVKKPKWYQFWKRKIGEWELVSPKQF